MGQLENSFKSMRDLKNWVEQDNTSSELDFLCVCFSFCSLNATAHSERAEY